MGISMGLFEFLRKRKVKRVKKHNDDIAGMVILAMKEEVAACLCDFLEAEFAQGIGADPDCKDIPYVKSIQSVHEGLKKAVKK